MRGVSAVADTEIGRANVLTPVTATHPLPSFFFLRIRRPPRPTLFPSPTLFRSVLPFDIAEIAKPPPERLDARRVGRCRHRDRKSKRLDSSHRYTPSAVFFFFKDPATTETYTLPLPDALPICSALRYSRDREAPAGTPRCAACRPLPTP